MGGFDHAAIGRAVSFPGIDTRQWISHGIVDPETPSAPSTRFKDASGKALETGPIVTVTLQPSGITVACRVASFAAGNGEGTWFPFQPGDEVLVALPGGMEAGAPTIIGRLNQAIDVWPAIVAGQDATKNNFGFWRLRTPFMIESAEAFVIRSAKTGSQVGIDATGQVILNNGDRNNLFIGADAINIGDGDQTIFLQLNFTEQRLTAAVGDSRFELSAVGESQLFCSGTLNLGTSGARGKGHAVTLEQVILLICNTVAALATMGAFNGPLPTNLFSVVGGYPGSAIPALQALLTAVLLPYAAPAPIPVGTGGLPGNSTLSLEPVLTPALMLALQNPLPITDPFGIVPGAGRPGLLL